MNTVKEVEFEDIITRFNDLGRIDFSLYQDKIIVFDIERMQSAANNKRVATHLPLIKFNAFCFIMVERGECVVNVDYRTIRIGKNMVVVLTKRHIIQFVSVSDDFRCYNSFVVADFLRKVAKDSQMQIPDIFAAFSFFSNPVICFEQDEFMLLKDNLERLRRNIHRNGHAFWHELVQNEFANLSFELRNYMLLKLGNEPKKQKYTRSEQVIARFFRLLLEFSRTEREVAFYADKLCVTPVYLSRAVKRAIGKPAIKVIQELAISDAMYFLRKPDMTIQDAADAMNFPDRETFSKFFRKIAGETPGEYRKKVRK